MKFAKFLKKILLHISSSFLEINLSTEFELPMLPLSGGKVCGGWVVGVETNFSVKL
jgi:hypothetical protein